MPCRPPSWILRFSRVVFRKTRFRLYFRVSTAFTRSVALAGPKRWPKLLRPCCRGRAPGSRAPFGMSMEALWRGAINMFREQSTAGFKVRLLGKFARRLAAYPLAILTLLIVVSAPAAALADCNTVRGEASDLDSGFVSLYVINFDAAHAEFAMCRAMYPEDPLGPFDDTIPSLFQDITLHRVHPTDHFTFTHN